MHRKLICIPLSLSFLVGIGPAASATSMFSASATASLEVIGVSGLVSIGGETFTSFGANGIAAPMGEAPVLGLDPMDLGLGDGLSQRASVTGSASAGSSDAFFFTDGFIDLVNLGLSSATVDFQLTYSLSATASVTDILFEDGFGLAALDLFDDDGDLFFSIVVADARDGVFDDSDGGVFLFSSTLSANQSRTIQLRADAEGGAFSQLAPIPEPASISLALVGLLFFFGIRKKRDS